MLASKPSGSRLLSVTLAFPDIHRRSEVTTLNSSSHRWMHCTPTGQLSLRCKVDQISSLISATLKAC
jgi:hypothetical protein